jgi:molybdate transport system substrate-binding protein
MLSRCAAFLALLLSLTVAFSASAQQRPITVFAAASLKNALDDVNAAFSKKNPDTKVVTSYAASSALIKQIEEGAPADVFISADLDWMDYGSQKKLVQDRTRFNLLGNRLVLIAPKDSPIKTIDVTPNADLAKIAGNARILVADVRAVPAGRYA